LSYSGNGCKVGAGDGALPAQTIRFRILQGGSGKFLIDAFCSEVDLHCKDVFRTIIYF